MKKIILMPDSFKGTMSSIEVSKIMENEIKKVYPDASILAYPIADGGEGTIDCFLKAKKGHLKKMWVSDPYGESIEAELGLLENGDVIIEVASCIGLPLTEDKPIPGIATSFGVGEQIKAALNSPTTKRIIIGLGGSSTTDGGCGIAAALGVKFTDSEGKEFIPVGETLINIKNIDISGLNPQVAQKQIIAMCDVENSLYGSKGAAFIFGPQKGADLDLIKKIDAGLRNLSSVVLNDLEIDISQLTGGGAAGGIGAGLYAFLGAKLQPGIDTILETVQVEKELSNTDLIITGEGKIDSQSIEGKVIAGIARMAKRNQVPAIAVVGDIGENIESLYDTGISGIFSINRVAKDFQITKKNSKADLSLTIYNLFHFIKTISS